MLRWLVILVGCASYALGSAAHGDESSVPPADPALWGVYSQLVGTSRQAGERGYRLSWSWSRPGEEILEQWTTPATGTVAFTHKITLGARPGQLVLSAPHLGGGTSDGTIQPDGAVLYIGRGLTKAAQLIGLAEDGYLETRRAKVKDGQIVSLAAATQYSRFALIEAPSSTATASSTAGQLVTSVSTAVSAASAPADPLADVAVWGDYARIVGRDWRGYYDISVRWSVPGKEIVEVWKYGPMTPATEGQTLRTITLRPDSKPGRLIATIAGSKMEGTRHGKIGKAGEVSFGAHSVKLIDADTVEHWGATFASNYSYKVFAVPPEPLAPPQRSTWGAYVDVAGQSFRSDAGSKPLLLSFGWLIPGKVLYELRHYLDDDQLYAIFIHASRDDGSLILRWSPPYNGDARGAVDANGKVSFVSKRTLGMRSANSLELLSSGQLQFMTDFSLDPKRTWTLSAVPNEQVPKIRMAAKRDKQERDRAEALARAERSQRRAELFGAMLGAAETFSQELSIAQARGGSADAQLGEATGRTLDQLRMQQQSAALAQQFRDSSADSMSSYSSSPGAGAAAFVDGTYVMEGGTYSIDARRDGADLVVTEPNKVSRYQAHSDGVWHFYNSNVDIVYGLRVIDGRTLEAFRPHQPGAAPSQLHRVGGAASVELKASNDETNAIAERYKQLAKEDPSNVQVWSACALAAHKRAVSPGPAADLYGMQMAQVLKEMMADGSPTPCDDAIPAALW